MCVSAFARTYQNLEFGLRTDVNLSLSLSPSLSLSHTHSLSLLALSVSCPELYVRGLENDEDDDEKCLLSHAQPIFGEFHWFSGFFLQNISV